MTNSRAKGKRGELEASKEWVRVMGGTARRGQQFAGGNSSPDVVSSHETLHLEVKRCEAGNPYQWMDQAVRDAGDKTPVVLHRRNGRDWLLIVRLCDAPRLATALGEAPEEVGKREIPDPVPGEGRHETAGTNGKHAGLLPVRRDCGDRTLKSAGQGEPD